MNKESYNQFFSVEFTIPRDLELAEGFEVKNGNEDFDIILSILKSNLKLPGTDAKNTTAIFVNNEDRFGDNVETILRADFNFKKDIFEDGLDEVIGTKENGQELLKDWMEGKRLKFCFDNILKLLNQIIETHQYVNDKYYIFPIELRNIYNIQVKYSKGGIIINSFGSGFFTNNQESKFKIAESTKKVFQFINKKEGFFEPLRIIKYSLEFMKMNLLRPAITEAQSAIEHLIEKKFFEKTGSHPDRNWGFWKKLEEYSKLSPNFYFNHFEDKKQLSDANNLRNDIIHGRETPSLTKTLCKEYLDTYSKLFNEIYLEGSK